MADFALHTDIECNVCGSTAQPLPIGFAQDHEYESTEIAFRVVRCMNCGLVYLRPRPAESELGRIYPPTYYSYHSIGNIEGEDGRPSFVQRLFYERNKKTLRAKLVRSGVLLNSLSRPARVLDVGCGVGTQLDLFKELLPSADLHGVEIGERAVKKTRERGHVAHLGRFEDIVLPLNYFDVVYSSHVIEHVTDPRRFLEKCNAVSSPAATIIIETPNTDSVEFDIFKGRHWGGYHAPRHFYLFDPRNMALLGQRTGLKAAVVQPYPSPIFWNWTCHSVLTAVAGKRVADIIFPPVTIFYGGVRSFFILGFFTVLEGLILKFSGRASAFWIAFKK